MAAESKRCTTRAQRRARFAATPAGRVVGTVELVENIILHMPIRDILVHASRVCKLWKKIVDETPEIQQALFFQPLPGGFLKNYTYEMEPREKFMTVRTGQFWAYDDTGPAIELFRNPFLENFRLGHEIFGRPPKRQDYYSARYDAINRDNASWRRMLMVQPPIRQVETLSTYKMWLSVFRFRNGTRWVQTRVLHTNPDGITLKDISTSCHWKWGSESAKITAISGDEVVLIEKPRPSREAKTEEPDILIRGEREIDRRESGRFRLQ